MSRSEETWAAVQRDIADILSVDLSEIYDSVGLGLHPAWDSLAHVRVMFMLENHLHRELATQEQAKSLFRYQ